MSVDELIDRLTVMKVTKEIKDTSTVCVFDRWKDEIYEVEDIQVDENGEKVIL